MFLSALLTTEVIADIMLENQCQHVCALNLALYSEQQQSRESTEIGRMKALTRFSGIFLWLGFIFRYGIMPRHEPSLSKRVHLTGRAGNYWAIVLIENTGIWTGSVSSHALCAYDANAFLLSFRDLYTAGIRVEKIYRDKHAVGVALERSTKHVPLH